MKKLHLFMIALLLVSGAKSQWFPIYADSMENMYNSHPAVYFPTSDVGYAVGGSRIWKTTDGGNSWLLQDSLTGTGLNSVYFVDTNTGYAAGGYMPLSGPPPQGMILKTTNGGETWTVMLSGPGPLYSIFFVNANIGYAVGSNQTSPSNARILKTTDGGLTWDTHLVTEVNYSWLSSVFFIDANTGFAVGGYTGVPYGRLIMKTIDGGANWITAWTEWEDALNSVFFTDINTGYSIGRNGWILKTTNSGTDWENQQINPDINLYSIFFIDANTGYAVGELSDYYHVILKTTDAGSIWNEQLIINAGFYFGLTSVQFPVADTGYISGVDYANGATFIFKTENGGGPTTGIVNQNKPASKLSIHPNPANDKITISSPATNGNTRLSIFNLSGEKVIERQLTEHKTQIDISALPRGVYFVMVQNETMVEVGKMVKE